MLFSWTNALEVAGSQGDSAAAIATFLESLGRHWTPLEMNPVAAIRKEERGTPANAPVSTTFLQYYFHYRLDSFAPTTVFDVGSEKALSLGGVLAWAQETATVEELKRQKELLDSVPRKLWDPSVKIRGPCEVLDEARPTSCVMNQMMILLQEQARSFQAKCGDGADFCHSGMALSSAGIATLDNQWKCRADEVTKRLNAHGRLARVFGPNELNQMVHFATQIVPRLVQRTRSKPTAFLGGEL